MLRLMEDVFLKLVQLCLSRNSLKSGRPSSAKLKIPATSLPHVVRLQVAIPEMHHVRSSILPSVRPPNPTTSPLFQSGRLLGPSARFVLVVIRSIGPLQWFSDSHRNCARTHTHTRSNITITQQMRNPSIRLPRPPVRPSVRPSVRPTDRRFLRSPSLLRPAVRSVVRSVVCSFVRRLNSHGVTDGWMDGWMDGGG